MERSLLRGFLYLVAGLGLIAAAIQANPRNTPREDPRAAIVCLVIAAAGLAASAKDGAEKV